MTIGLSLPETAETEKRKLGRANNQYTNSTYVHSTPESSVEAMEAVPKTVVVGGGLVGSLQALSLAKRGFNVELYESRKDIRRTSEFSGRSINLALSFRGRQALKMIGLESTVLEGAIPMYARMIHSVAGNTSSQAYGKSTQCIYSVDRRKLNELLLDEADRNPNISLNFEHKLVRASLKDRELTFWKAKEDREVTVNADFVFGCDGAYSTVRRQMMRWGRLNYQQEYIDHGYKELTMPPTASGDYAMALNYLHIWPRGNFMMIALPNKDCSFTLTMFMPYDVFDAIETEEDLLAFFMKYFADSVDKIGVARLVHDYFKNPVGRLVSVKCYPHFMADSVLIMGDASHAVVPFYGQGMNAGFEDCLIYYELLDQENDLLKAAALYSKSHWRDCHAIADLSLYNYHEMRSHVNSRLFLLRKKVDNVLHMVFPRTFIPLYTMVAFTRIPYHVIIERNRVQRRIVTGLLATGTVIFVFAVGLFVVRQVAPDLFVSSKNFLPAL